MTQKIMLAWKKIAFLQLDFQIKTLKLIEHQFDLIQHGANIWSKNTDVIQIQQQDDKLLIT